MKHNDTLSEFAKEKLVKDEEFRKIKNEVEYLTEENTKQK